MAPTETKTWLRAATLAFIAVAMSCGPEDDGERPSRPPGDDGFAATTPPASALLLDPDDPAWREPAPDTFRARFETTRGDFVIEVVRALAPLGADRFYNLVRHGYYDDARFHRAVPDFIVQWGLAGDPAVTLAWQDRGLPDEPVLASNTRGSVAFAFAAPDSRSTQVFISLVDLSRLDASGFSPFGRVVEGMDVVDALYSGYGERSGGGLRAGAQDSVAQMGNAYLDRAFPLLDHLIRASVQSGDIP